MAALHSLFLSWLPEHPCRYGSGSQVVCCVRAEIKFSVILSSLPLMFVMRILLQYQWSVWALLEKASVN